MVNNAMTADFLRSAYGGESMAHMRYLIWGEVARKEGLNNIGTLFEAIAYAEYVHANNHFNVLKEQKEILLFLQELSLAIQQLLKIFKVP